MSAKASDAAGGGPTSGTTGQVAGAAPAKSAVLVERDRKRFELLSSNQRFWSEEPEPPSGALDSNLKKNTGFIKRIRQGLGVDSKEQLLKELLTLNLDKYKEEIIQAVPEGLSRCTLAKDCFAAAEIMSAFHARFGATTFTVPLTTLLSSLLAPSSAQALSALPDDQREREETARVARQKQLLRVIADLAIVEALGLKVPKSPKKREKLVINPENDPPCGSEWLYTIIKELLATDREHTNVPIILSLLKALGSTLIGPNDVASGDSAEPQAVATEMRSKFRKLFETYYGTLSKRLTKEHSRLLDQDKRNHEAYIKSGEIFEDRQQKYEKLTKAFERVHEWTKLFSDMVGQPLPVLENKNKGPDIGLNLDSRSALGIERDDELFASGKSPWEDDDTRRFYEDIPVLTDMVPMSMLTAGQTPLSLKQAAAVVGDGWAKTMPAKDDALLEETALPLNGDTPTDAAGGPVEADTANGDVALTEGILSPEGANAELPPTEETAHSAADGLSSNASAQLSALLARLPEMTNRTMIDSASVEFAFINSKASRKRLIKHLCAVPKHRFDLIPYYARMIATLQPFMPDVGAGVITYLDEEFRYLRRKRIKELTEVRSRNARYLSELTKFRIMPLHVIFHSFKSCLDDFHTTSIEQLATFLENCGRFLLRTEETSERFRSLLEMLRRKRAAVNVDHQYALILDNAYYQCNPPEHRGISHKVRSPTELFIRHLLYDFLSKRTVEKVVKHLRKLHWDDPDTRRILHAAFTRVWRVQFSNIDMIAVLLYELQPHHPDFAVEVIDEVLENMRVGMETNIFKHNQRRVATVKYFGELYNYRLINSNMIFDQLWSFTSFGHPGGRPLPPHVQVSAIDVPDDYFRIRLICTLLDTCGMCFDRGSLKKRLDEYLVFANLYVTCKEQPVPMEIDFMLEDVLELLRPNWPWKKTFEEIAPEVDALMAAHRTEQPATADKEEDESSSSDDDDEDDIHASGPRGSRANEDGDSAGEELEDGAEEEEHVEESDDEVDTSMARRREEDEEFERELAKLMAESSGGGGGATRPSRSQLEQGIPFIKPSGAGKAIALQRTRSQGTVGAHGTSSGEEEDEEDKQETQQMRFSLLSKKGNRVQSHDVYVPVDSAIAVSTRSGQIRDQAERERLKQLVLSYEGQQHLHEQKDLEQTMARRGIRLKFADG